MAKRLSSLRQKILIFVGALIVLCLCGSTISLYRITEIHRTLDAINRVSVPLSRLLSQLKVDGEVLERETERRLAFKNWSDPRWQPKPVPRWIEDVIDTEIERAEKLIESPLPWALEDSKKTWEQWILEVKTEFAAVKAGTLTLQRALAEKDDALAAKTYPDWIEKREQWVRKLQWGASEFERSLRQNFSYAQSRTSQLRTGLEVLLGVVVALSLLVLWLGERAFRPLAELTQWARTITLRGLKKEDKALLPEDSLLRNDEVGTLAKEFHRMATALLEREKVVESQRDNLQESNRLLREMGELNQNILNSIKSALIVTDFSGMITQCNPGACVFLGAESTQILGTSLLSWEPLKAFSGSESWLSSLTSSRQVIRIDPATRHGRVYGGSLMPLWKETGGAYGAILAIEDLTEELSLQERLRYAENLAAIGRMSAQVAHEVRNPLHSIGLEAEMAAELAAKSGSLPLKNSLESILFSVERLEKITENYLKLSKLSQGSRALTDLGDILESVLATYSQNCEALKVKVDWMREPNASLRFWGDADVMEQALGNLFKNSLQALESAGIREPQILWTLGAAESGRIWVSIEDNGPGIGGDLQSRLFTPFVTTKAQGTGLGLSFTKKVIEDHGGTIEYSPSRRSGGARFIVQLPSAEMAETAGMAEMKEEHHGTHPFGG